MTISGDSISLTSRGNDSGIVIDRITQKLPAGPYKLTFQLQSRASGSGSVFFTTDRNTPLPKGRRQEFNVTHDGVWHAINLDLDTTESLTALRLDVCSGVGESTIKYMTLLSTDGNRLVTWPTQQ